MVDIIWTVFLHFYKQIIIYFYYVFTMNNSLVLLLACPWIQEWNLSSVQGCRTREANRCQAFVSRQFLSDLLRGSWSPDVHHLPWPGEECMLSSPRTIGRYLSSIHECSLIVCLNIDWSTFLGWIPQSAIQFASDAEWIEGTRNPEGGTS